MSTTLVPLVDELQIECWACRRDMRKTAFDGAAVARVEFEIGERFQC